MNGFEPLRRRIIDYTEAGQWSEVYDGPLEDCESEKLQAENAKLRELVEDMLDCIEIREAFDRPPTSEMCEEFARRADELGVEVDV